MWEMDCEGWVLKHWCFWTVVLEKTLESPLDFKKIQTLHPNGNQSWIFIGKIDAEAESPTFLPPYAKNWLIEKNPGAGQDWQWMEKGTTEDEMVGWHQLRDGHQFLQAPGVGDRLGSLDCSSPWIQKKSDKTEGLNWTELNWTVHFVCSSAGGFSLVQPCT